MPEGDEKTNPAPVDDAPTLGKGEAAIEELQRDLECPACQYNLRGLRGAVVKCPECGADVDIARLVSRKWTLKWWQAPGVNLLAAPVAVALVGGVIVLIALAYDASHSRPPLTAMGLAVGCVALWSWLMVSIYKFWQGAWGCVLAMFAHAVLLLYDAGAIFALVGLVVSLSGADRAVVGVPMFLGGITAIVAGRWLERYIGHQCIRRYLARG